MTPFEPLTALPVRRRADELDRLIDTAPAGSDGPAGLAQALRRTGDALDATVLPREQFRDELRTRLMAVAAVQGVGAAATAPASAARAAAPR
ncbi:MAG: hypothetical protein JWN08_3381, partial [Frankiales bacterium]|nr:hypothetical protein [Frankiales bacterium]